MVLKTLLKAAIVSLIVTSLSTPRPIFKNMKTTKPAAFLENNVLKFHQ
jgi:hypothetical protein